MEVFVEFYLLIHYPPQQFRYILPRSLGESSCFFCEILFFAGEANILLKLRLNSLKKHF